ncbi:MAG: J domain-containing protein [Ruegeria sp.]
MEPVDKIQARAEALEALGLDQTASGTELRNAWRKIAFQAHPDRAGGDSKRFSQAKSAYDFLRKDGMFGKPAGSAFPRRPKLRKRIVELAEDTIEACRHLLKPIQTHLSETQAPNQTTAASECTDHIPAAVGCHGRDLTYFVATPVSEGENRIALPTSILASCRNVETEILSFQAKNAGGGEIVIPDPIRERKFPGARSVKIRFEAGQKDREHFWQVC